MARALTVALAIITSYSHDSVRADLIDNGGGLIYYTGSDITWVQGVARPWEKAVAEVKDFTVASTTCLDTTSSGLSFTGSEVRRLCYTELHDPPFDLTSPDKVPFTDLHAHGYWSRTDRSSKTMWFFDFMGGTQYTDDRVFAYGVFEVYCVDVLVNGVALPNGLPVQIPGAIILFAASPGSHDA